MKALILVLVAVAVVSAYFYYIYDPVDMTVDVPVVEIVEPVDMPLPATTAPAQIAVYENTDYDFTFKYRINPYGYSLFENNLEQNSEQGTLFGVTLVRTTDYNESVKAAAAGNAHDGPPSMSVYVFTAPVGTNLAQWLVQNNQLSNCVEGTVMPISVAGEAGASCLWDGLYAGETRAVQKATKIYVLTGTRENMETLEGYSYAKDFMKVVESFTITN